MRRLLIGAVVLTPLLGILEDHCYPAGSRFESSLGYYRPDGAKSFTESYPLPSSWLSTPGGVLYEGPEFRAAELDRVTNLTLSCLQQKGFITFLPVKVIIAADWRWSCDGTEQILPVLAPSAGCLSKGPQVKGCECHWRAGVRDGNVIVTTPNLLLYPDALTRLLTGSANPWADSHLVPCLGPWTKPTDGST